MFYFTRNHGVLGRNIISQKPHIPLVGETRSGLVLVDTDGFTVTAKRTCGGTCESVTATDA